MPVYTSVSVVFPRNKLMLIQRDKFDFKAMDDEVFKYEDDKLAGQVLTSVVDGTFTSYSSLTTADVSIGSHAYYKYLNDLVVSGRMEGNPLKANLYQSLEPLLTRFIGDWQEFNEKYFSPPSFSWDTALSASFMEFPDELKMAVFDVVPHSDLLTLRLVNKRLWALITPIMHSRLRFRMPPSGWSAFEERSTMVYEWAAAVEILGAIFIDEAWFPVVSVTFQSWPMSQYCFFKFLKNAVVTSVAITGHRYPLLFFPHIPYPFMLPPTVKSLVVTRCSLTCHSLLGLLSPGTMLESLEFDRVDDGFVITPVNPTWTDVHDWRELNGLSSYCQSLVQNPPPASLQRLKISFAPVIRPVVEDGEPSTLYQPTFMQHLFVSQLFRVPQSQPIFKLYLQNNETFPVHLRLCSLVELDLCLGSFLYRYVRWGWSEMSESLTTLTIWACDVEASEYGNGHLPLAGLMSLKHVKLVAPVSSIHCMLWSVMTWTSPAKESSSATLGITVCVDRLSRWDFPRELSEMFLQHILLSTRYTEYHHFGGSVHISIASTLPRPVLAEEVKYLTRICNDLACDESVKAIFLTPRLIIFPEYIRNIVIHS
ncbi:hypothetical protein IW261DRAFT_1562166 [Armillaria novae-zelandiae]|uniref:F-box domain-containing protein n=1 Tax=Armillaria novae-zelandiae TaxID=153914 RepID=A0AA39PE08_9AGAR|nr:hypothetical protein IW261DRAFT_1562166 [Armillaria novae-zelandiae]